MAMNACQKDKIPLEKDVIYDYAQKFMEEHQTVDNDLSSQFHELSLAYLNKVVPTTNYICTYTVAFYLEKQENYTAENLAEEAMKIYGLTKDLYVQDLAGIDLELYTLADKVLLVGRVLTRKKDSEISTRNVACTYTESLTWLEFWSGNCPSFSTAPIAIQNRFNNLRCYLPPLPTPPFGWEHNYGWIYRIAPNSISSGPVGQYYKSCGDPTSPLDCFELLQNDDNLLRPGNCATSGPTSFPYCAYMIDPITNKYRLYFDVNNSTSNCISENEMNFLQESAADLALDFKDNYLYNLDPNFIPNIIRIKHGYTGTPSRQSHLAVIEYVKFGILPGGQTGN